jgi:predicted ATPase
MHCNVRAFVNTGQSFRYYVTDLKVNNFRHIQELEISFDYPVTILTGTNKIGKTSLLLLLACSHVNFFKYDSTKHEPNFREHIWKDVISFTDYEAATNNYSYNLNWRVGPEQRQGEGKRLASSKAWTGLAKYSSDPRRVNAKIRDRFVRLIDLERLLPVRNFSNNLKKKIKSGSGTRLNPEIEKAFSYVLSLPPTIRISKIGAHINKMAFLIEYGTEPYSSYNAASGEESLIHILIDIFDTPSNSLILIDEIEAGFHPSIQRKLADVIQYVSWSEKKQFVITTHSPSILAAFPQKARKFIERKPNGTYNVISNISVNAAFSKMDSESYPLLQLYCEDSEAQYILKKMLVTINQTSPNFDRLVNVVVSGPANMVRDDYERHKHNYGQLRLKLGYACVFDGDHKIVAGFSKYYKNAEEFSFFLQSTVPPEVSLINCYLASNANVELQSFIDHGDHHFAYDQMVTLGLASDNEDARACCWNLFINTQEYQHLYAAFKTFITRTVTHFSRLSD